jgi:N6-L-threonylcarbamoyladenine synthase
MQEASDILLAIESSCDETSAAVLLNGKLCCNVIATQQIHQQYGGVVPELASRDHQKNIVPVVQAALSQAGVQQSDLTAIAFTRGPGLLGSLLVGASFAKAMALALEVPLIEVNHMQAHVLAHFLEEPSPSFPFLCLTVSGGHTQLVLVKSALDMEVIGQTQDDAVGEAFDKTAKLLGLPYPGGPLIDHYAQHGNPQAYSFPIVEMPGLDYSFSGIKTAFMYFLRQQEERHVGFREQSLPDICASVQHTLVRILMKQLVKAAQQTGIKEVAIAGGVAANSGLRQALQDTGQELLWKTYIPRFAYCTDNAAMIGMAAYFKAQAGQFAPQSVTPEANWTF